MDIPEDVMINRIQQCKCCPLCHQQIPCDSVMAGAPCDNYCQCDIEEEEDYSLPWE